MTSLNDFIFHMVIVYSQLYELSHGFRVICNQSFVGDLKSENKIKIQFYLKIKNIYIYKDIAQNPCESS